MKLRWSVIVLFVFLFSFSAWSQEEEVISLRDCVRIALDKNITVQTYDNLARSAANNVKASYSNILPTLDVSYRGGLFRSGDGTNQQDVPISIVVLDTINGVVVPRTQTIGFTNQEVVNPGFTRNFYSVSFDVNQTLFDGGNWWNAIKKSKADRAVADYEYTARTNEVVRLVSQYFFDLLKQEKLYEVYELAVQRSQDNLDKSEKMFEIGSVAKVDVFRARVNLGNDRIALIQQRNTVQQARQNLNIAMGRDPHIPLNIRREFDYEYQLPELDDLIQTAHENQPEIRRREMDLRSRELNAAVAKSTFFPTLGAFFSYNRDNADIEKIYTDLNQNWSTTIGVGGRWNLFNGFADQVRVQNAKIAQKNAMLAQEDYKRNLRSTVTMLHDTYKNLEEIVEINKENLEAAREEYRLASERYRLGSGTSLDVRESQVNLTEAERILVAAEYNLIITYAELLEAIGTIQTLFNL
jgi:outer membrane protein TolC